MPLACGHLEGGRQLRATGINEVRNFALDGIEHFQGGQDDLVLKKLKAAQRVFSDFSYPPYIVEMLLDLVEDMVKGHGGEQLLTM